MPCPIRLFNKPRKALTCPYVTASVCGLPEQDRQPRSYNSCSFVFIRGYYGAVKFEFFDHTADLGVTVFAATQEELFPNAAAALYHALGDFHLKPERVTQQLTLKENSAEELLVAFLGELLYRFDAHRLLFDQVEIQELKSCSLAATITGGEVDFSRSEPNYEIKAVTYHHAKIESSKEGWRATIILDV